MFYYINSKHEFKMRKADALYMSQQGCCSRYVEELFGRYEAALLAIPYESVIAEIKEWGCYDELEDMRDNLHILLWIIAGQLAEELKAERRKPSRARS